ASACVSVTQAEACVSVTQAEACVSVTQAEACGYEWGPPPPAEGCPRDGAAAKVLALGTPPGDPGAPVPGRPGSLHSRDVLPGQPAAARRPEGARPARLPGRAQPPQRQPRRLAEPPDHAPPARPRGPPGRFLRGSRPAVGPVPALRGLGRRHRPG